VHSTTCINGHETDELSSADRGLHYGDGLFETITCIDGRPRWLALHLQRLRSGCERLQLRFDAYEALTREIEAQAAGQRRCIVKLIVTRGAGQRGYAPQGDEQPTRIVKRYDWPQAGGAQGFRVALSSVSLGINPLLAGVKHLNRLEQVLARNAMRGAPLEEVLMLSSAGQIVGGSMSNVFFGNRSGLCTPALHECGVAGIMRQLVCAAAERCGVPLAVRNVEVAELAEMQEAFVTNVRWGVQPITQLQGRPLSSRGWAEALQASIDAQPS